jgi:hypothetical protein
VKKPRRLRPTTQPPSVSLLSRQCAILDISQPCMFAWPVTYLLTYLPSKETFPKQEYTVKLNVDLDILKKNPASHEAVSIPNEVIEFFTLPNPSSCTTNLGLTQSITGMSTRYLSSGGGGEARPARKADNLTDICQPIV